MGWTGFILALVAFTASHYLPARTGLKTAGVARLGARGYHAVYGLVSLLLLGWVVVAAGRAPFVTLWPAEPWTRWVPFAAMPVAFVLTAAGLGCAQPFTLGGKRAAVFDPARPGIAAVTRHPLLLALALWSGAHLVANGDLAHAILFGAFLAMSVGFVPLFDARARAALSPAGARAFFDATAILSLAPLGDADWRRANRGLAIRAGIGLVLWLAALLLHPLVFGVSPLPV
ncbi:NnrU family protein [Palleronia sediminis]|uniref:NnrU family protein n=1 Tax=Palleronia sediminis TaxID=2547833 RepID=A0A4R6ADY9_9RHOB|nr:NnrU family protein [Palleronia sediminis]TDL79423.1 NnrU family protein [Palleronia sediminis]